MNFIYGMVKLGFSLDYILSLNYYEKAIYWGVMLADGGEIDG